MEFNGSSDFASENVTVYLIKAKGSEVFDGLSKLRAGEITDFNDLFNTSFKNYTKSYEKLDANGDLSLTLGNQSAGHYVVLVSLDNAGSHFLLSATVFEVLPYEMSLTTPENIDSKNSSAISAVPISISAGTQL